MPAVPAQEEGGCLALASCSRTDPPGAVAAALAEHGFCIFRGFLRAGEAAAALAEAERVAAALAARVAAGDVAAEHAQYDDASRHSTLKQIQRLHSYDAYFGDLMERRLRPVAEAALGEAVRSVNMQYFNKPPTSAYPAGGSSRETPPHQDGYYFMIEPQSAVTMWLALEDADEENGCLHYVRGSAARGMRPHDFSGIMGFSQSITDYGERDAVEEVPVVACAGDLVIHHSMMVHRAPRNRSETRSRRAVGAIFYGASARADEAALSARQREIQLRGSRLKGQTPASVGIREGSQL